MSTLLVPDAAKLKMLNDMIGAETPILKLFQSNTTPGASTLLGNLTEATFGGYAGQSITLSAAAIVGGKASTGSSLKTFTHNGSSPTNQIIYGYYVVSGSTLLWAERFDSPQTMSVNGDKINITPVLTLTTE